MDDVWVMVHFPVAKVFFTKEARYVVFRRRVGIPVESGLGESAGIGFVRFRVWPLDGEREGFRTGSLGNFSWRGERLSPLYRAEHRVPHRWVVVAVVVDAGGSTVGLTSNASARSPWRKADAQMWPSDERLSQTSASAQLLQPGCTDQR
jgi:hypothetical protein